MDTATNKVKEVAERLGAAGDNKPDLIIGADTMVSMDGKVYGKPGSEENAVKMLKE